MEALRWFGIILCLLHSAAFSGLNLALFGVSRLRLEIAAEKGNAAAKRILGLRRDANYLLSTILWGNVAANTMLTLLSESVLAGVGAFAFATVGITFFGEIIPQAYFSRNALWIGNKLAPFLLFYQKVLLPVAKPSGKMLDAWIGPEGIGYLGETELRNIIEVHMHAEDADEVSRVEGTGALNFLELDDLLLAQEGEVVDPDSVIELPTRVDLPLIPPFDRSFDDEFLKRVSRSGKKWVILVNENDEPGLLLDADGFLRAALVADGPVDPYAFCHRPVVVRDVETKIGNVLRRLHVVPEHPEDDVIDLDVLLLWTPNNRRVLTGADILGRLMRGIARRTVPVVA